MHLEEFCDKRIVLQREREIKRMKSHKYIERLIHAEGRPDPPVVDREVPPAPQGRQREGGKTFLIESFHIHSANRNSPNYAFSRYNDLMSG